MLWCIGVKDVEQDSRLKWSEYMTEIKKATIHRIIKALSPKRHSNNKAIPRSITPKAVEYITDHINQYIESIVRA